MYVCMYVCMYITMYVCVYVHLYVCMGVEAAVFVVGVCVFFSGSGILLGVFVVFVLGVELGREFVVVVAVVVVLQMRS